MKLSDDERRERHRVRTRDGHVIRKRKLRQPCEVCGATPAECHHIDYNDPERRMWLCKAHHEQTHSQFGRPAPADWMADIRAAMRRIDAQRPSLRGPLPAPTWKVD